MKFNIKRYKELLVKAESSKKIGREYFQDPEILELLNYESKVENQFLYEEKNEYLRLIQPGDFRCEYLDMIKKSIEKTSKILNNLDELSHFWIDPEGESLGSLLSNIQESCQCINEFGIEVLEMKKHDIH